MLIKPQGKGRDLTLGSIDVVVGKQIVQLSCGMYCLELSAGLDGAASSGPQLLRRSLAFIMDAGLKVQGQFAVEIHVLRQSSLLQMLPSYSSLRLFV